jgi:Cys-tRNA(Pro)/Cys-tRNA(Cys) deacylase
MTVVNNVTRLLDSKNIRYTALELPEEKLGAPESAAFLNVPVSVIYKTIVIRRDHPGKPILAIVPGDRRVDLKLLAKVLDEKKLRVTTEREAEDMTGLKVGGISPLALISNGFTIVLDAQSQQEKEIHISGGQRGLNIRLAVVDLIDLIHPRVAPISSPMPDHPTL